MYKTYEHTNERIKRYINNRKGREDCILLGFFSCSLIVVYSLKLVYMLNIINNVKSSCL